MKRTEKPKLALITNWYPPKSSSATNRMISFGQYLFEEFEVTVFTDGGISVNDKPENGRKSSEFPTTIFLRK